MTSPTTSIKPWHSQPAESGVAQRWAIADDFLHAFLGIEDGSHPTLGRGQVVGEVPRPLGEHAQQRKVGLEAALGVDRVEVLGDGHAPNRSVPVAHLGQPSVGVETVQERRTGANKRGKIQVTPDHAVHGGRRLFVELGRTYGDPPVGEGGQLGIGPEGDMDDPGIDEGQKLLGAQQRRAGLEPVDSSLILVWKSR